MLVGLILKGAELRFNPFLYPYHFPVVLYFKILNFGKSKIK